MREVVVRGFEPGDAEAVAALICELAAFHGDEAGATAQDVLRYSFSDHRLSTIWVAALGDEHCGFVAAYDWMNYIGGFPVRNIDLVFVRDGARGRGIGRALIGAVARDAEASSCRRMTVGAEAGNVGANAFYRHLGFELRDLRANRYVVADAALARLASV